MQAGHIVILVGLVMGLIAGWGFFASKKNRTKALASAAWPHVTGIVTARHVVREERSRRDSDDNETYYWVYDPQIWYEYTVNGTTYTGRRISFGQQPVGSEKAAIKILDQYTTGNPVQVFYNPADPTDATLSTTAKGTLASMVVFGIVAIVGVVVFAVGVMIWAKSP